MIEYASKFLQLLHFGMYLILNEEKKVEKFEKGLNSRIQIMMNYFDIQDFSLLVDQASIYKESLKKNAAKYVDEKVRDQVPGTSTGGAGLAKRSQGCTSSNPLVLPQRNQMSELCKKCNEYTGTPQDGNRNLLSMRPIRSLQQGLRGQRSYSETFSTSLSLRACSRRAKRRIRSSNRYCPCTWI